jgi:hypothetical protein
MDGKRRMTARCACYIIDQTMARSSLRDAAMIIGVDEKTVREDRGLIFSVGDPPTEDRFVRECCLAVLPKSKLRLPPPKHFGRWQKEDLRQNSNVCSSCLQFAADTWRQARDTFPTCAWMTLSPQADAHPRPVIIFVESPSSFYISS